MLKTLSRLVRCTVLVHPRTLHKCILCPVLVVTRFSGILINRARTIVEDRRTYCTIVKPRAIASQTTLGCYVDLPRFCRTIFVLRCLRIAS